MSVRAFLKTPKGLTLCVLAGIAVPASLFQPTARAWGQIGAAMAAAGVTDAVLLRRRYPRWEVPSGALITALIVAMIVSPFEPWWVAAAASVGAVLSKYVLRVGAANIFNPAALALVVLVHTLGTSQNWWGALPDAPWWGLVLLIGAGAVLAGSVNKLPAALAFLAAFFAVFTVAAYAGHADVAAKIFRSPNLQATIFFACIMLTDPPTAPIAPADQLFFALLVAAASSAVFLRGAGVVDYLPAGLLAGNVWEAWRRRRFLRARRLK